jgi:hypothetical protein
MAQFKGCLTPWIEGGGRGNGRGLWCGARGSDSMVGEDAAALGGGAKLAVAALPCFGAEGGTSGRVGRVGQKAVQADGAAGSSWARN